MNNDQPPATPVAPAPENGQVKKEVPGSVMSIGAMAGIVTAFRNNLPADLQHLVDDGVEALALGYARLLATEGAMEDPLQQGVLGTLRKLKAVLYAAITIAQELPPTERERFLYALQVPSKVQKKLFVNASYGDNDGTENALDGMGGTTNMTREEHALLAGFKVAANDLCDPAPTQAQQERRNRFRQWAQETHGIANENFTILVYEVNRRYLPWLQNVIQTISGPISPHVIYSVLHSMGDAFSRTLWKFDPTSGIPLETIAESALRDRYRSFQLKRSPIAPVQQSSASVEPAIPAPSADRAKIANAETIALSAFSKLTKTWAKRSSPLQQQRERNLRKWATVDGADTMELNDLVYQVLLKQLTWLKDAVESAPLPPNTDADHVFEKICTQAAISLFLFNPKNESYDFPSYASPYIGNTLMKCRATHAAHSADPQHADGVDVAAPLPVAEDTPVEEAIVTSTPSDEGKTINGAAAVVDETEKTGDGETDAAAKDAGAVEADAAAAQGGEEEEDGEEEEEEKSAPPEDRETAFMKWLARIPIVASTPGEGARLLADQYDSLAQNAAGKMVHNRLNRNAELKKPDLYKIAHHALLEYARRFNPSIDEDFVQGAQTAMHQEMTSAINKKDTDKLRERKID